jgi:hypothetical protein
LAQGRRMMGSGRPRFSYLSVEGGFDEVRKFFQAAGAGAPTRLVALCSGAANHRGPSRHGFRDRRPLINYIRRPQA